MATSSKVFVSPGVYTSEKELSFVAQSVGVTTLGIAGETLKGPAFEPIFISNYDEFSAFFGGTSPEKFVNTQIPKYEAAYIAKSYLQQSNQLFVTRVLGLSGYDAGPSWSLKINANMDSTTVVPYSCLTECVAGVYITTACTSPVSVAFTANFTGNTCSAAGVTISGDSNFTTYITPSLTEEYQKFNGSVSTIEDDIQEQIVAVMTTNALSATSIYYFGSIPNTAYTPTLTARTSSVNVFSVPAPTNQDSLSARTNDSWYFALFNQYAPDVTVLANETSATPNYSGISFYSIVSTLTPLTALTTCTGTGSTTTTSTTTDSCASPVPPAPSVTTTTTSCCYYFSGTITGRIYTYFGKQFNNFQDLVIATLRSRGVADYVNDNSQVYEVSNLNYVGLDCSGSYALVNKNPFVPFAITGFTDAGNYFNFKISMNNTDKNFIDKVLGVENFSKPKSEVPLFVEENYSNLLNYGWNKGYIRGINCTPIALNSARSNTTDSIAWYLDKYQSPLTPFIVSELRGNLVYKLFKFHSISDGTAANVEIKISIANISFTYGTFDVLVRDYNDTDKNPTVLEKFTSCSMDPALNNFIAKKIGTLNGDYSLKSKYIMVEMSDEFPSDALPCGFEGYTMREYNGNSVPPFVPYKTKYDYAGEIIFDPPFGYVNGFDNSIASAGDKVRSAYLGISSEIPVDSDFFQYKGKQNVSALELCTSETADAWLYMTRGFHMDVNASVVKITSEFTTSGKQAFDVGVVSFIEEPTSPSDPYYRIQSRKFTLLLQNGFDGWDIYNQSRTNTDNFILGGSGYRKGACPSVRYADATGQGMFKEIALSDVFADYGNTDYYAYLYAIRQFANPQSISINVLATPGIDYVNNLQLVESTISMVEQERADSIYVVTTPDTDMFLPTITSADVYQAQEVVDNLEDSQLDTNYTVSYNPWILVKDTVKNTQVYIPPTNEVCRNLALTDNIAFPWFATAGYTRGLVNSVKARKKLTQEDRDTLYLGRINPIATFSDVGTVIWGNKTMQVSESALNRLSVRRLLLQARKLISAVAVRLLFEQNDNKVRQDFLDAVNPILDAIRRDRGLYDFRVTVSSTTEDMDRNQLVGKIYIKPTKSLEFIDIEFLITPTGASFEDV